MSAPLVPSPLDYVGRRPFAFYPPIRNATPNEWVLGTGSWTEVQVINARDRYDLWIPRQFIGAVSETDEPLLVVGLTRALIFHEGSIEPRVKQVIEMPYTPRLRLRHKDESRPLHSASVVGIRLERNSRTMKARGVLAIAAAALTLLAALVAAASRL
ncbi:MAG: hypothetical protein JOY54_17705 [Acidobacteriaceae bacterium]|nr:hypothetical protein [Acidobacteriaceae bacterium]